MTGARRVELFEPAMCCQTGVCGPSVDHQLIDVRESVVVLVARELMEGEISAEIGAELRLDQEGRALLQEDLRSPRTRRSAAAPTSSGSSPTTRP
jgi:hypothetical protein